MWRSMAFPICLIVAFFNNKFTIQIFRNVQNFSITDCINVFCIRIYFAFFLHLIKLLFVIKVSRHHINKIIKFHHVFYLRKHRFVHYTVYAVFHVLSIKTAAQANRVAGRGMIYSLLFQVAEQVFFVYTVGDKLGEAVNDDLLVLSIGDAKPLIVGRQDLNADLVGV